MSAAVIQIVGLGFRAKTNVMIPLRGLSVFLGVEGLEFWGFRAKDSGI